MTSGQAGSYSTVVTPCRAKETELAAVADSASHSSRSEQEATKTAAKAQAGAQRLEADIQRLQHYITHLENTNRYSMHLSISCKYSTTKNSSRTAMIRL